MEMNLTTLCTSKSVKPLMLLVPKKLLKHIYVHPKTIYSLSGAVVIKP